MVNSDSNITKEQATHRIKDEERFLYFLEYLAEREVWPIERGCMLLLPVHCFRRYAVHEGVEHDCKVPPDHLYVEMFMDSVHEYKLTEGKSGIKSIDTRDGVAVLPQDFIDFATLKRIDKHWPDFMKSRDDSPIPHPSHGEHTTAKVWHTKNAALHISTKTNRKMDGRATFDLRSGKSTKQRSLVQLLAVRHPDGSTIRELAQSLYPQEQLDLKSVEKITKRLCDVVSNVRKKLKAAGIDPEILPVLSRAKTDYRTKVRFNVAKVNVQGDLKRLHPDDELRVLKSKSNSVETSQSFDIQATDDGHTLHDSHKGGDLRHEIQDSQ